MAKVTTRLSDKEIKSAKPKEKEYILSDGDGLRLRVKPNGSKLWLLNYTHPIKRKRTNLSLGKYPDLSLANARKTSQEAKELLAQGIDPQEERKRHQQELKAVHEDNFLNVATKWFEIKKDDVTADYAVDIWRSLELHIFPNLSDVPVREIKAPQVIELLKPIEAKGSLETVKRLAQRLNEVMNYATNCGLVQANPLTGIKAAFKKPKKENMAALKPAELPELMGAIANASIKRTTRCLIEWQLHTMTRPSEASGARWEEIDWDEKVWAIPAERMKKRREHRIPLTEQMLELLEVIKPISGHREFIFPSDRDPKKPCNSQTANMALKRMGFAGRLVSHGLRSLASTTLNEQGFDRDIIEAALAHVDDNQVRSAYNRTDYLERRRPMMYWWSEHIEEASKGKLSITSALALKAVI
ncbi:integrase domain-containing protein [Vibrio parahaemolyticus]|uniref:integrase domain-containing protein n=1 Tax=Vibrio parahaemolyticus TaxID=670 RepID=UPI00215BCBB2|nr:integrase domain-containing protein [Vibrio parahaemolyticus]MCR9731614.1 integrase domain-containing protein [Vibrio parahaemolyticus]MCR9752058.1 integrase domain-containing protein [Vibrio parahaemolyticus]MCR9785554.1 integrase domain-containing protein [Vibrio parahaemolyticus]MCR9860477.1 integrase domain-containing protein [Vibrio parahaemolyticus]MCZ6416991.1 integrase domain-containing protein [Vibrio parahaemolyticus]